MPAFSLLQIQFVKFQCKNPISVIHPRNDTQAKVNNTYWDLFNAILGCATISSYPHGVSVLEKETEGVLFLMFVCVSFNYCDLEKDPRFALIFFSFRVGIQMGYTQKFSQLSHMWLSSYGIIKPLVTLINSCILSRASFHISARHISVFPLSWLAYYRECEHLISGW